MFKKLILLNQTHKPDVSTVHVSHIFIFFQIFIGNWKQQKLSSGNLMIEYDLPSPLINMPCMPYSLHTYQNYVLIYTLVNNAHGLIIYLHTQFQKVSPYFWSPSRSSVRREVTGNGILNCKWHSHFPMKEKALSQDHDLR